VEKTDPANERQPREQFTTTAWIVKEKEYYTVGKVGSSSDGNGCLLLDSVQAAAAT
jgi:hypothetical protein